MSPRAPQRATSAATSVATNATMSSSPASMRRAAIPSPAPQPRAAAPSVSSGDLALFALPGDVTGRLVVVLPLLLAADLLAPWIVLGDAQIAPARARVVCSGGGAALRTHRGDDGVSALSPASSSGGGSTGRLRARIGRWTDPPADGWSIWRPCRKPHWRRDDRAPECVHRLRNADTHSWATAPRAGHRAICLYRRRWSAGHRQLSPP